MNGTFLSRSTFRLLVCAAAALGAFRLTRAADVLPPAAQNEVSFAKDVRVILAHDCLKCHAGDNQTAMRKAATQPAKTPAPKPAAAAKPSTEQLAKLPTREIVGRVFVHALSRQPTAKERAVYERIVGAEPTPESVADLLWVVAMLPSFS